MHALRLIVAMGFLAIIGIFVYQMVQSYRAIAQQPGDWEGRTEQFFALAWGSATKLWAKLVAIVASLIGYVATFTDTLNAPQVTDFINKYADPKWVTAILAGIFVLTSLITLKARNRTANDPTQ